MYIIVHYHNCSQWSQDNDNPIKRCKQAWSIRIKGAVNIQIIMLGFIRPTTTDCKKSTSIWGPACEHLHTRPGGNTWQGSSSRHQFGRHPDFQGDVWKDKPLIDALCARPAFCVRRVLRSRIHCHRAFSLAVNSSRDASEMCLFKNAKAFLDKHISLASPSFKKTRRCQWTLALFDCIIIFYRPRVCGWATGLSCQMAQADTGRKTTSRNAANTTRSPNAGAASQTLVQPWPNVGQRYRVCRVNTLNVAQFSCGISGGDEFKFRITCRHRTSRIPGKYSLAWF